VRRRSVSVQAVFFVVDVEADVLLTDRDTGGDADGCGSCYPRSELDLLSAEVLSDDDGELRDGECESSPLAFHSTLS
jgi:hypothetical protein